MKREFIKSDEKKKIAKAALGLIGQNDSIIIGSGTTVFELARQLYPNKRIIVITPALKVALELINRPNVEILQLGDWSIKAPLPQQGPLQKRSWMNCPVVYFLLEWTVLTWSMALPSPIL